jgi:hypothetical protein
MADLLHFRKISPTMLGCFLVLDDEDENTGGELIASISGPATLNIPIREAFIKLCQDIVDHICDDCGKPRFQWNLTQYVRT